MVARISSLRQSLVQDQLRLSQADHLIRELVVNAKQLRDVGGDESKLTADYVRQWDQNKADLSVMPSEAVKLAEEELR